MKCVVDEPVLTKTKNERFRVQQHSAAPKKNDLPNVLPFEPVPTQTKKE